MFVNEDFFSKPRSGEYPHDWNNCSSDLRPFRVCHCFMISVDTLNSPFTLGAMTLRILESMAHCEILILPGFGCSPLSPSLGIAPTSTGGAAGATGPVSGTLEWKGKLCWFSGTPWEFHHHESVVKEHRCFWGECFFVWGPKQIRSKIPNKWSCS